MSKKFLSNLLSIYCIGWFIFSPISPMLEFKYSQDERNSLLNKENRIILINNSENNIESFFGSDIEDDTEFILPTFPED